jgi:hypothetical protein
MPDPALTEALLIALDYLKATGQAIGHDTEQLVAGAIFVGMAKRDKASHTAGQCGNRSGRARPKRRPSTPCIFCEDASLIVELTKAASHCGLTASVMVRFLVFSRVIPTTES